MKGDGGVEDWQQQRDGEEEGKGGEYGFLGGHGEVMGGWEKVFGCRGFGNG